ncbi:hypothetical protein [Tenacibaculum sp. 190524A02b]|uniref:hypothetical protein n=1 Tax=Tenacibaculum vairaonense TaxID=3137860 RepID=UPI0031FABCBB
MTEALKKEIGEMLILAINANNIGTHNVWFELTGHVDAIHLRIEQDDNSFFSDTSYIKGSLYGKVEFKNKMKIWRKELLEIINPKISLNV